MEGRNLGQTLDLGGAAISLDWPGPPINHFMAVIKEYRGTPDLPGVAGSLAQVCEDKC